MAEERIGIDFGTSTILVGTRTGGVGPVQVVPIGTSTSWMPSLIGIDGGGVVVGEAAEGLPEASTVRSVKTLMYEGKKEVNLSPPGQKATTIAVASAVEALLRAVVERSRAAGVPLEGRPVRLSCPANWTAAPRQMLADVAVDAGLDASVNRMLDEPISAGVAWIMGLYLRGEQIPDGKVVVFDYGGGTLDVAVLEVKPASPPEITVLAASAKHEAGDLLDAHIAGQMLLDAGPAAQRGAEALSETEIERLFRMAARRMKEALSSAPSATTAVSFGSGEPIEVGYTRAQLEQTFGPMLQRALALVWSTLKATELRRRGASTPDLIRAMEHADLVKDVSSVLLAGGMSRIPLVKRELELAFPDAVVSHDPSVSAPEESVVSGLVHDEVVSELNLDRPAFDMRVRIVDARSGEVLGDQLVFPAFSPLYRPDQVVRGESGLGYGHPIINPTSRAVRAEMTCHGIDGSVLPLYLDGSAAASLDVEVPPRKQVPFKLYVDGRVAFGHRLLRVDRWPVIRGGASSPISFESPPSTYTDMQMPGWWGERP